MSQQMGSTLKAISLFLFMNFVVESCVGGLVTSMRLSEEAIKNLRYQIFAFFHEGVLVRICL